MKLIKPLGSALLMCVAIVLTGCGGGAVEGLYNTTTADGVKIGMKRYRPSPSHNYSNGTPILLANGITLNNHQWDTFTPPYLNSYKFELPDDAPAWAKNDPMAEHPRRAASCLIDKS